MKDTDLTWKKDIHHSLPKNGRPNNSVCGVLNTWPLSLSSRQLSHLIANLIQEGVQSSLSSWKNLKQKAMLGEVAVMALDLSVKHSPLNAI